jgi:hypothetical protein
LSEYDDILEKAREAAEQFRSTAKEFIPKMYKALRNENHNISPEDARDRIEKDCVGIWVKRTILDALPDEAKNREKQKAGRLRQKEYNSAAFSAAAEPAKRKVMVSSHGAIYTQDSPVDELKSITNTSQAYTRENICDLQPQEKPTNIQNNATEMHNCPNCEQLLIKNQKIQSEKDLKIKQLEDEIQQYYNDLKIKISENAGMRIQIDRLKEQLKVKDENNSSISSSSSSDAYSQLESSAILDLEFCLKYEDVHKYVSSMLKVSGALGPLWFNCRLEKRTCNIIAAYPGSIVERTKSDDIDKGYNRND